MFATIEFFIYELLLTSENLQWNKRWITLGKELCSQWIFLLTPVLFMFRQLLRRRFSKHDKEMYCSDNKKKTLIYREQPDITTLGNVEMSGVRVPLRKTLHPAPLQKVTVRWLFSQQRTDWLVHSSPDQSQLAKRMWWSRSTP